MHTKHPFIILHTQLSSSFIPSFNRSDPKFVDLLTTYSFYEKVNERSLQIRGTRQISYFFLFLFYFLFFHLFFRFLALFPSSFKKYQEIIEVLKKRQCVHTRIPRKKLQFIFFSIFFFIYSFIEISQNFSLQQSSLLDYKIIKNAYASKDVRVFTLVCIC